MRLRTKVGGKRLYMATEGLGSAHCEEEGSGWGGRRG